GVIMVDDVRETLRRAAEHQAAGQPHDAEALCRAVLAHAPSDPQALLLLGQALIDTGRATEAVAALRQSVALQPGSAEVHNQLGRALQATGSLKDAIAVYTRAI